MKNIFKERKIHIACVCLLLVMLLAGCSNSDTNNQETDLFDVLNRADSVKIGNHIVVYNSESGNICYGEMVNDKPKIIKNIALPYKNANVNQIIASDNWIYVVVEVMASEKTADVRIICRYDLQMNLKEVNHTMYHNIYYKDGYLFGYDDGNVKIMTVYFFISRHVILRQHIMLRKRIGKINGIKFLRKKRRRKSVLLFYIGMKMIYVMMCHIFLIIKQFLYFAGEKFVLPE
ncbi:MAG: hypothetical protein UCK04_07915 [Eubacterium sp.]|nr:hypothetical protein [Eubacterium sp.]